VERQTVGRRALEEHGIKAPGHAPHPWRLTQGLRCDPQTGRCCRTRLAAWPHSRRRPIPSPRAAAPRAVWSSGGARKREDCLRTLHASLDRWIPRADQDAGLGTAADDGKCDGKSARDQRGPGCLLGLPLVRPAGLEPATGRLEVGSSIHLSYGRFLGIAHDKDVERVRGIEPPQRPWKGRALPLGDTRLLPIPPARREPAHTGPSSALIGAAGFEPATSCAQGTRAAKLRHAPPLACFPRRPAGHGFFS
jgi:hypothetical protein